MPPPSALAVEPEPVPRPEFPALYDDNVDMVWRALRRLGVPEPQLEDAVQEVFLTAHRRLDAFEGRSAVTTWLYGIAVFVARNARRTARRKPETPLLPAHEEALISAPPDEALAGRDASRLVESLLAELPEEKREVFVLAELEQLSGPEIAASLELNLNTVYGRLRHARQAFEEAVVRWRNKRLNRRSA